MKAAGFVLLAAALFAAAPSRRNPYDGDPQAVRAGRKLYERNCSACHGKSAEGMGRAPALRSKAIQGAPSAALFQILTHGVMRRGMPSWAHLPEQQRWQIITYLKSLGDRP
jgi:mono/diheme cytochrome c family protein